VTNPRLAVIILTSTFPRWDGDTDPAFVFDLAQRLSRTCDIDVLCPSAPGTKQAEVFHGVQVRRFRYFFRRWETLAYGGGILNRFRQSRWYYGLVPFFMAGELLALMRRLRAARADIINAHWLIPQGLVAVAARALTGSGAGLVCTLHGGDIFGLKGGLMTQLQRLVLRRCDRVNVVSSAVAAAVAALGVEQQRIAVIPMGVDLRDRFTPGEAVRAQKSILYVGRFAEKKGLAYLIDALPLVLQKHSDARLTIVGHGPLEAVLRARIAGLGLSKAVTILGALANSELPAIYQRHEIVVFPSIVDNRGDTEGFGLVMVEAMGCGCAVIASDLPAIHDSIIDGETGLLAPQQDPAALAGRITELLDDPALLRRLAAQGRAHVCSRFDWEMTAQKYAQVFQYLVSQCTAKK
jgi:glycosyltransferase involved in cell wall biosynthesis